MSIIQIQTDLALARRALAQHVTELRNARQQVRDAQKKVAAAQTVVNRHAKRKTRFLLSIK